MKNIFRKILPWLVLGVIVRLVLMPITLHADLWTITFSQYFFAFKGVTNIYDYLANLSPFSSLASNYGSNFFTYPPLSYFTLGIFGFILKPFFNADFLANLADNLPTILNDGRLPWHLFLTKLPYLFFDLGILILLTSFFEDKGKKELVSILWLFNPLSIYTSFMIGQFDIIPVFFSILSLFLIKKKRSNWAAFSLGIGGAYKMFPLFFLPFLAITEGKNSLGKLKLLIIGLLPYVVSLLPFIGSPVFRQTVLLSNQSQKMLFAKIPVSGAEYLSVFVVFYIFLLGIAFLKKTDLWKSFMVVLLLFFGVTHYHPQWFLWLTPFLILFLVDSPKMKILPIILFFCWFLIMIFFEPSLSISLFAPLDKSLANIKPLSETINRYYDVFQFKSLVRSVFAGTAIFLAFNMIASSNKTSD